MIQIVGTQLSQWDVGRSVSIANSDATHIHFANQGDSKAVIIEIENGSAKIPDYLLQTGKQVIAYAVLDGVTLESKSFPVRKRERPENYVYEEDQRNYIYELITNAENATESARMAANSANTAAGSANLSSTRANEAATSATKASDAANLAAKNANEATTKATNAVKNMMVVGEAKGTAITIDNAIDQTLVGLRVFGKTTQDGTPTPDASVELVSVGDSGNITVNVNGENESQSMTISTPNGLPGIPVTSGGNYTDANGQQRIGDVVDLGRGVRENRTVRFSFAVADMNGSESYPGWRNAGIAKYYPEASNAIGRYGAVAMCNIDSNPSENVHINTKEGYDVILIPNPNGMTQTEWKTQYPNLVFELIVSIPAPIETPLTEEELAAYASLHTYKDHTTVSNDAGAYMELEYVMDAKKYIDGLITGTILPARVE